MRHSVHIRRSGLEEELSWVWGSRSRFDLNVSIASKELEVFAWEAPDYPLDLMSVSANARMES
jgi:hypothetical protein